MRGKRRPRPTKICPACGARIAAGALACRECGSDAETGWSSADEQSMAQVELPEFDEDDYQRVIGEIENRPSAALPMWVKIAVIVALVAFAIWVLGI